MTQHTEAHPLAGRVVTLSEKASDPHRGIVVAGAEYRIEDWWDHLTGGSWQDASGNIAAVLYGFRASLAGLPPDDEVVYGHIGNFGHLVHVSELGEEAA